MEAKNFIDGLRHCNHKNLTILLPTLNWNWDKPFIYEFRPCTRIYLSLEEQRIELYENEGREIISNKELLNLIRKIIKTENLTMPSIWIPDSYKSGTIRPVKSWIIDHETIRLQI